jgi:hypothetical protein
LSRDVRQAIAGCASLTSAFDSKRPADCISRAMRPASSSAGVMFEALTSDGDEPIGAVTALKDRRSRTSASSQRCSKNHGLARCSAASNTALTRSCIFSALKPWVNRPQPDCLEAWTSAIDSQPTCAASVTTGHLPGGPGLRSWGGSRLCQQDREGDYLRWPRDHRKVCGGAASRPSRVFRNSRPDVTEEVESKAPGEAANSRAALLTPKGAALSLASAGATALFALVLARDVRPVRNAGPQSGRSGDKFRRQPRGEGTR